MWAPLLGALVGAILVRLYAAVPIAGWAVYGYGAAAGALILVLLYGFWRLVRYRQRAMLPSRWSLLGALFAVLIAAAHARFVPPAPAVILLVIDCMRADLLSADTSPNLMKLVASSWNFTQARAHSSWTRTSMPSMLSSRLPAEHELYRTTPPDRIRADIQLISQHFAAAGYATAGIAEQAQLVRAFGYGRGFQIYDPHAGLSRELNQKARVWNGVFRSAPRFVFMHYMDIHGPYTAAKRWLPKKFPRTRLALHPSSRWRATIRGIRDGAVTPTESDWAAMRTFYEGEMRELDAELGRLIRGWREDGTLSNAWVVITADHGEAFGEHGAIEHVSTPWDVLLRVPLVIRPPGGTEGKTLDHPVMLVDVVPTLLSATGLPTPPELYGRDLLPLTRGENIPEIPGFAEERASRIQRVAVWWKGWKLMREEPLPGTTAQQLRNASPVLQGTHLYHIAEDPGETVNLAESEPGRVAELEGVLVAYLRAAKNKTVIREIDWEAAARSGERWSADMVEGETADASEETMRALEELGYVDDADGDADGDGAGSAEAAPGAAEPNPTP